jgi:hypothetical protein
MGEIVFMIIVRTIILFLTFIMMHGILSLFTETHPLTSLLYSSVLLAIFPILE